MARIKNIINPWEFDEYYEGPSVREAKLAMAQDVVQSITDFDITVQEVFDDLVEGESYVVVEK